MGCKKRTICNAESYRVCGRGVPAASASSYAAPFIPAVRPKDENAARERGETGWGVGSSGHLCGRINISSVGGRDNDLCLIAYQCNEFGGDVL